MKSEISNEKIVERPVCPRLMRFCHPDGEGNEFTILEHAPQHGVVVWVASGSGKVVGEYSKNWSTYTNNWKPETEQITLSN